MKTDLTFTTDATTHNTAPTAPRLVATAEGFRVATAAPRALPVDTIPLYDSSTEVACAACSHDGCVHFHSPQRRLSRRDAQGFLRYTENTLFTKHSRGEMPAAISGPPLEFDTCHLAAFKFDGVLLTTAQYVRAAHLAAIPAAREERARRQREKSEKLSAHMRQRHAAARKSAKRPNASRSTVGSTARRANKGGAR